MYAPAKNEFYETRFHLEERPYNQVGTLQDASPWVRMGNDASNLRTGHDEARIDVVDIANTGSFKAIFQFPEASYVIGLDRFHECSPCQDGGVAVFLFEHQDAGCGDSNWPNSTLYVAGWGSGHATLNGNGHYTEYEFHF